MKFNLLFAGGKLKIPLETTLSDHAQVENFSEVIESITKAQGYLAYQKVEGLISWLDAVCESWSDRNSQIQKRYSAQGLNFLIYWFRKKHLLEITNLALRGNREVLDRFCSVTGSDVKLSAQPRGVVSHWIAGNVPMLGMLSLIQGILTKNANLVKVPKDNAHVVPSLLESMAKVDIVTSDGKKLVGKKIVESIACIYYTSMDQDALREMSLHSQVRVAWGGMEAVETIINLPRKFGCEDIVFGPKTSFMAIGAEKLTDREQATLVAKKASIDASQFEQQGCNAPHTVFVERGGGVSPVEFAEILSEQMAATAKRVASDPTVVADTAKILRLRAQYEMTGEAYYSKGLEWTVLYSDDDVGLAEPCYFRTLFVRPIDDVMSLDAHCSHQTQTAGVAIADDRKERFARRVSAKGIDRVPDVGAMTAYEVPWDGMFMMDRLVRWCRLS